jgi:hypothetical protein
MGSRDRKSSITFKGDFIKKSLETDSTKFSSIDEIDDEVDYEDETSIANFDLNENYSPILQKNDFRGISLDASWNFFRSASFALLSEMLIEVEGPQSKYAEEMFQKIIDSRVWPCRAVLRQLLTTILNIPSADKLLAIRLTERFREKGWLYDDQIISV